MVFISPANPVRMPFRPTAADPQVSMTDSGLFHVQGFGSTYLVEGEKRALVETGASYCVPSIIDALEQRGVTDDLDGELRPHPDTHIPDLGADEYAPHVDVALRKTRESSATLLGGDAISFTLTLSASAASELAPDVQVVDAVAPASAVAAIAGQTVNGTCSGAGATLTCTLYSVPTNTVRTVTVWMTTTQDFAGVFTNTAAATVINAEDTNAGNNAGGPVTATVLAKQPDLWAVSYTHLTLPTN